MYVIIDDDGKVLTPNVSKDVFKRAIESPEDIVFGDKFVNGEWVRCGKRYEPTQEQIQTEKIKKITESKTKLEEYLVNNPYLFSDGKYYTVTKEKQNLLTNAITVYRIKVDAEDPTATLKWNAVGEVCTNWTLEDISDLVTGIAYYVSLLVTKQQEYEVQINACTTKEELDSIVIDYATV